MECINYYYLLIALNIQSSVLKMFINYVVKWFSAILLEDIQSVPKTRTIEKLVMYIL